MSGVRNLCILSWATWIVHFRWRAAKSINFILQFYLVSLWGRVTSPDLLLPYLLIMELRFDAMLFITMAVL